MWYVGHWAPPRPAGLGRGKGGQTRGFKGPESWLPDQPVSGPPRRWVADCRNTTLGVAGPASPVNHVRFDLGSLIPLASVLCMWNEGVDL